MPSRLGQHFLRSQSILTRIAEAACAESVPVVEIGPGKGALTEHLIARAPHVTAIEIDQVLVAYLEQRFRNEPKLTVIHSDILRADLAGLGRIAVAGNLPYYITSPIIDKVLKLRGNLALAVFLVQKEVAERIAAAPGSRDYGYLSVQTQVMAEPKILFTVPPGAFQPPPKVDSAVVRLTPRVTPLVQDVDAFLRFASVCFRQKRKTLRNNLAEAYPREVLDAIPETKRRAEQLSVFELAALQQRILNT